MDGIAYIKFVLALVLVLGLIWLAAWALRRFGFGESAPLRRADRRLRIVESLTLDGRHRAVLIRRDDVEHLVLLGAAAQSVIESGITPKSLGSDPKLSAGDP